MPEEQYTSPPAIGTALLHTEPVREGIERVTLEVGCTLGEPKRWSGTAGPGTAVPVTTDQLARMFVASHWRQCGCNASIALETRLGFPTVPA